MSKLFPASPGLSGGASLRRRAHFAIGALFTVFALVMAHPVSAPWLPVLPDSDDAMFSVWRLAWVAHALRTSPAQIFDANIFYPATHTLAYSDAMLLLGALGAPLQWAGVHPVLVHNVLLVASFALAGYAAFLLTYHVTHDQPSSIFGGFVFAFAPYRFAHIGHLELLWTPFIALAVLAILRLVERPSFARGLWVGLALAAQGLSSLYYFIFTLIYVSVLTLTYLLVTKTIPTRRLVASALAGALLTGAILAPYAATYVATRSDLRTRQVEEIRRYSAVPGDYLRTAPSNRLYGGPPREAQDERSLFPGALASLLAVVGVTAMMRRKREPHVVAMLVAGGVAFDLSLGFNGFLYPRLLDLTPGLDSFRAPARFGVFVLLSIAVLAALGIRHLVIQSRARIAVTTAAVALLACEYWSRPIGIREMLVAPPPIYRWLAQQPKAVVLELPVPDPTGLWLYETTHQYMSIYHWQPLVNGYSGNAPDGYVRTLETLREFPFGKTEERLRALGVNYILVHERLIGSQRFADLLENISKVPFLGRLTMLPEPGGTVAVVQVVK